MPLEYMAEDAATAALFGDDYTTGASESRAITIQDLVRAQALIEAPDRKRFEDEFNTPVEDAWVIISPRFIEQAGYEFRRWLWWIARKTDVRVSRYAPEDTMYVANKSIFLESWGDFMTLADSTLEHLGNWPPWLQFVTHYVAPLRGLPDL